ncbi:MAG: hypothetical protein KGH67_03785 [Candidatus Micrarchaeota archaeon]|nr:hypothetical protein [Candidatus Micrarchaeota archaeon]MDE1859623.1 hypothetical protein [Candidatus Micrarchaeota archaeon]
MHYIVSIPVNEKIASFIGKKGSEESLIFYNRKVDQDVIVALYPSNDELKWYYSMASSMLLASQIVISTETVDKMLGEALIAASLLDKRVLVLNENDVSKIVGNGMLKNYEIISREELLGKITSVKTLDQHNQLRIDVDHAFPVKGIGTVALGIVMGGKVKVHDSLHSTSGKQVSVKSIQSQDVDIQEAGIGTRVGLALKGAEPEDIQKGDLLLSRPAAKSKSATSTLQLSSFASEKIEPQSRYTFVSNFTHVVVKVENYEGNKATLTFEKPISILEGDSFLLIRESNPKIFSSGRIISTS